MGINVNYDINLEYQIRDYGVGWCGGIIGYSQEREISPGRLWEQCYCGNYKEYFGDVAPSTGIALKQ